MAGITGVNFCGAIPAGGVALSETGKVGEAIKRQLRKRLTKLNISTAPNCSDLKHNERFGKDGIKEILKRIKTRNDAIIADNMLDELEKGKSIWTYDICKKLDPEYGTPFSKIVHAPIDVFVSSKKI